MSLLVRLSYLCRDAAADIVAVRQRPGSDIACARGTGCFVASFTPATDLTGVCHPRRQCFAEPAGVLGRQIDFILRAVQCKTDRLVGGSPVVIVFENDLHALRHKFLQFGKVRVPDRCEITRVLHFPEEKSRAISRAGAEWVIAPTATKLTPVRATSTAFSNVRPPLASKVASSANSATIPAMTSGLILSSRISVAPAATTWRACSAEVTSTSTGTSGKDCRTA